VILPFEFLFTDCTEELAFITVCELVFSQGTGVVETFMALVTFYLASFTWGHLALSILTFRFCSFLLITWIHSI